MMNRLSNNQHGVAHLGFSLALVLVISTIGFVGYGVYQNSSSKAETFDTDVIVDPFETEEAIDCFAPEPLPPQCAQYE